MLKYDGTITVGRQGGTRKLTTSGDHKRIVGAAAAGSASASHDPVFVSVALADMDPVKPETVSSATKVERPKPPKPSKAPATPKPEGAVETAWGGPQPLPSAQPNTASSMNMDPNIMGSLLAEYINDDQLTGQPNISLNRIFWDIYYNQSVCGSGVDMLAKIPFSEFSITGLRDEKALRPFLESCNNIQALKLLPEATVEHYVVGHHCGALSWDDSKKTYTGYITFDADYTRMQDVLNYGDDPIITVNVHPAQKAALEGSEEHFVEARKRLNADLLDRLKNKDAPLRPEEVIFIPRRANPRDFQGRSLYRRALPVWFIEKALMRGTLDSSYKRQKAIRHITAGEGEEWVPTSDEMTAIANLFLKAELDPLSSIVVTREGINVNELGSPESFWRWDQNADQFGTMYMRALGFNEAFITGEANYATLDQTLSVFIEGIRAFRSTMTQEFFYDKMFPRISYANNLLARRYGIERAGFTVGATTSMQTRDELWGVVGGTLLTSPLELGAAGFDTRNLDLTRYAIPKVHWHKRLMPEADSAYLDILGTLSQNGVKIPLRMWAAAGGLDINSIMEDKPDDIALAADMKDWARQTQPFNPEMEAQGGGGGGGFEFSSTQNGGLVLTPRRVGLAKRMEQEDRDDPAAEFADIDSRGQRRVMTRQGRDIIENRFNKRLAEALSKAALRSNHYIRQDHAAYLESK